MIYEIGHIPTEFIDVIRKNDELQKRLNWMLQQQPRTWTGVLRRSTFARAIRASNSIEGYNVTYEDAVAAVDSEQPSEDRTDAWRAVSGYRTAMSYILQLADDPYYTHNEGTIRSLHYIMIGFDITKHPGKWRPGSIYVRHEPTSEIVYEGPDGTYVPSLMKEFIDSLNESGPATSPLVKAAMAHLNMVMIHPFSDGNGRMGRALQTMVLSRAGILDPIFSSIEEYLGRNTQAYYDVLAAVGQGSWQPSNDPLPWVRFCLIAHFRQAETLLRRTKELARLWSEIEVELKKRGLKERLTLALVDAGLGHRVYNWSYRKAAEVSDEVASKDLRSLCEHKLLLPRGERRGRYYVASDWLVSLRGSTRERKTTTDPFIGNQM
jgi:Fic family protein